MPDESTFRQPPFGGFTVEPVTISNGRYLLFYSWPEPTAPAAGTEEERAGEDRAEPGRGPRDATPWTPEAGPLEG